MRGTGTVPGVSVGPELPVLTCRSATVHPTPSHCSYSGPTRPYYSPYYCLGWIRATPTPSRRAASATLTLAITQPYKNFYVCVNQTVMPSPPAARCAIAGQVAQTITVRGV